MDRVRALLDRVFEVCPLPQTTERVLERTAGDECSIPTVAETIASDPALASVVLRVANSAVFGGGKVEDLDRAILRIGLRGLRELAAAMSLFAMFRNPAELSLSLHDRSLLCGAIAHRIAKETGVVVPSTAFVCGLLGEIGAMVCLAVDGREYLAIWKAADGDGTQRRRLEVERYGVNSYVVGQRFLLRSQIPENVANAVGTSGDGDVSCESPLSKVMVLAREAVPVVVRLGVDAAHGQAREELQKVAGRVGLQDVDGERLYAMALGAGEVAVQVLGRNR